MLFRLLAPLFNALPPRWQRFILDRAHPRFLVGVNGVGVNADRTVILARHRFGTPAWRHLGGFIERDESLPEALAREIREETGWEIEVGPLLEASTGHHWARVEIVHAYRVVGGTKRLSVELLEVAAFPLDRLPPLRADHRGILERHAETAIAWARGRRDPATIDIR